MANEYAQQPWKGLYLATQGFTTLFLRLPVWLAWYSLSFNRPKPTWPMNRAIVRQVYKLYLATSHKVGSLRAAEPDHTAIVDGPGVKGVWIPATPELIVGRVKQWALIANIDSISIPAYWFEKSPGTRTADAPPVRGEKVLLSFHGGAYADLSAHPSSPGAIAPRGIVDRTSIARALVVEYRKSRPPPDAICFPAALIDSIAAYKYLIRDVGVAPEDVILFGDSSGGNQILAVARYIIESRDALGDALPLPGGLIIHSTYADIGNSDLDNKDSSIYTNQKYDFYTMDDIDRQREMFLGPFGRDGARSNPYISPASEAPTMEHVSFIGFPRTLNLVGGCEILRDQNRVLNERMKRDMGDDVTYVEMPDALHDFMNMPWHEPERSQSWKIVESWLKAGEKV